MNKCLDRIKELKVQIKKLEEELCYIEDEMIEKESKHKILSDAENDEISHLKFLNQIKYNITNLKSSAIKEFIKNFLTCIIIPILLGSILFLSWSTSNPIAYLLTIILICGPIIGIMSYNEFKDSIYYKSKNYLKEQNIDDIDKEIEKQNEKINTIRFNKDNIYNRIVKLDSKKMILRVKKEFMDKNLDDILNNGQDCINEYYIEGLLLDNTFNKENKGVDSKKNEKQLKKIKNDMNR